jgi:O-antigen ligase
MLQMSRPLIVGTSPLGDGYNDKGKAWSRWVRFFPALVPLVLGLFFGIYLGGLIANEAWYFLVPLAFLIPTTIVFFGYPFVAVLLWVLFFPYFIETSSVATRYVYWILHRAMIPIGIGTIFLWFGIRKKKLIRLGLAELSMVLFLALACTNIFLLSEDLSKSTIHPQTKLDAAQKSSAKAPPPGITIHFTHFYDKVFIPFCMYWLVRLLAPKEKDLKRLLPVAFITVIGQFGISLLSRFAPEVLPPQWLGLEGARTVGSFGNAAPYTSTLLFLSLLLFQHAMHCKSRWVRSTLLLTVGLAFFGVFFSFSRGSWLGGFVVLTGLLYLYPKIIVRSILVFGMLTVVLCSTLLVRDLGWASDRLEDTGTAENRIITAATSIRMIIEKPWFGWGYDNYDIYAPSFQTRVGNISYNKYNTSHNTYLTIITEMGLIAFFLYILPVVWLLILSLKVWRKLPQTGFWSWRLLAMLWLLVLHQFIVSSFMDMISSHLFGTTLWWMTLGLIASMVYSQVGATNIGRPQIGSPA